jgi:hypothetical protein
VQALIQKTVIASVLQSRESVRVPRLVRLLVKLPGIRKIPARMIGIGLWRVHVEN